MTNNFPGRRNLRWRKIPFIGLEFTRRAIGRGAEIRRTADLDHEDSMVTLYGIDAGRVIERERNKARLEEMRQDPDTREYIDHIDAEIRGALDDVLALQAKDEEAPITDPERENVRQVVESFAGTGYEWPDITDDEVDDLVRSVRNLDEIDANSIMTQSNALGIDVGRRRAIIGEAWYGFAGLHVADRAAALPESEELTTEEHQCRHRIPAIGGDLDGDVGQFVAYVGWDRALNTFFLQVGRSNAEHNAPDEIDGENYEMHWVGTRWGEIPTVGALAAHVWNGTEGDAHIGAPWAELSFEMADHLAAYQQAMPADRNPRHMHAGGFSI